MQLYISSIVIYHDNRSDASLPQICMCEYKILLNIYDICIYNLHRPVIISKFQCYFYYYLRVTVIYDIYKYNIYNK